MPRHKAGGTEGAARLSWRTAFPKGNAPLPIRSPCGTQRPVRYDFGTALRDAWSSRRRGPAHRQQIDHQVEKLGHRPAVDSARPCETRRIQHSPVLAPAWSRTAAVFRQAHADPRAGHPARGKGRPWPRSKVSRITTGVPQQGQGRVSGLRSVEALNVVSLCLRVSRSRKPARTHP